MIDSMYMPTSWITKPDMGSSRNHITLATLLCVYMKKSMGKKVLVHILLIILGESLRPSTTLDPFFKTGQRRLFTQTQYITDEPYQISIPF